MTHNENAYAICCRPEVDDDVLVEMQKTITDYIVVNSEVASYSSYRDFPKRLFCDGEVCDGNGGVNTICSPQVVEDVLSGIDVDTFQFYAV